MRRNNQPVKSAAAKAATRSLVLPTALLLFLAVPARAGWDYNPPGYTTPSSPTRDNIYSFNPPLINGVACPGTLLSISTSISDTDTWMNGEVQAATLMVAIHCQLTGPGVNQTWDAVGTDSAPPLPLTASATLSAQYALCTPGQYSLQTWYYESSTPADDPGWPPTVQPLTFTVAQAQVSVVMDAVICCPGCSYSLQGASANGIKVINSGDCAADLDWQLTGNGAALDPTNPFTPSSGSVTVPAHGTARIYAHVNTDPNAADGAGASITITLTGPGACTGQVASATAPVTVHLPRLTVGGASTDTQVPWNKDDDDQDAVPDYEDSYVPGENELAGVTVNANGLPGCGTLTLAIQGGNVQLWTTAAKGTLVTQLTWPAGSPPPTMYLEGTAVSSAPQDVTLTLTYNGSGCNPPGCSCSTTLHVTVFNVDTHLEGPTVPGPNGQEVVLIAPNILAPFTITYEPPAFDCGDITLTWNDDPDTRKVAVWDSPDKTNELSSPQTWPADGQNQPPTLYVEGTKGSDTLGDVVFSATWDCQGTTTTSTTTAAAVIVDVAPANVTEAQDEEPGAPVMKNYDNDNNNTYPNPMPDTRPAWIHPVQPTYDPRPLEPVWDMDEWQTVNDEDDLLPVTITVKPSDLPGNAILTVTSNGRIRLWASPTKGDAPVTVPTEGYPVSQLPKTFYVEGIDTGPAEMKLEYTYQGTTYRDRAVINVVWLKETQAGTPRVINAYNTGITFTVQGGVTGYEYLWDFDGDGRGNDVFEQGRTNPRTITYGSAPDGASYVNLPENLANHRKQYNDSVQLQPGDLVLPRTIRVALAHYYGTALTTATDYPTREAEIEDIDDVPGPFDDPPDSGPYTQAKHEQQLGIHKLIKDYHLQYAERLADNATTSWNPAKGTARQVYLVAVGWPPYYTLQTREDVTAALHHENRHVAQHNAVKSAQAGNVWYELDTYYQSPSGYADFREAEGYFAEVGDGSIGFYHLIGPDHDDLDQFAEKYNSAVGLCNGFTNPSAVRTAARQLLQDLYQELPFDAMTRAEYQYEYVRPPR